MPLVGPQRGLSIPVFVAAVVSILILLSLLKHNGAERPTFPWSKSLAEPINTHAQDDDVLNFLHLTPAFEYRRQRIVVKPTAGLSRKKLLNVTWSPFNAPVKVLRVDELQAEPNEFPPSTSSHTLEVPVTPKADVEADTASLILGVATPLHRIEESLPEMARWLANTQTLLLVHVRDRPEEPAIAAIEARAADLNMNVRITRPDYPEEGEAQTNFRLAAALDAVRTPQTKWFGVIDDDTFFVSLPRLLAALAPYDPEEEWYIGTLTERHWGVAVEGFKAWGGAGMFISPPLMANLAAHTEECIRPETWNGGMWGDALWRDCIVKVTSPTVKLTQLDGLNQEDFVGSVAGWYESGLTKLLSLHHWKSWHDYPVHVAHLVTDVAGLDVFLQRYRLGDGQGEDGALARTSGEKNAIFVNAYSIVQYPNGLPDLGLVEGTMYPWPGSVMPDNAGEFFDQLGSLRPILEEGKEKISWNFTHSVKAEDGCVRQFYVKRGKGIGDEATRQESDNAWDPDSVIELDWCRH